MSTSSRRLVAAALQHVNSWQSHASTQVLAAAGRPSSLIGSVQMGGDEQSGTPTCEQYKNPCLVKQWNSTVQHVRLPWQQTGLFTATAIGGSLCRTARCISADTQSKGASDSQAPPVTASSSSNQDPLWTLPNMISLARAVSGPFIAYLIIDHNYSWALGAVIISGMSDWADGALARRLGQNSVLGSYLDPIADKVLVGCVAGALGWEGLIPSWVAALVVGRDVALVGGGLLARWHMLGWRVKGMTRAQFFSTVPGGGAPGEGQAVHAAPPMRPLMISKINTVLQIALIAGSLSAHAASWPDADVLKVLEYTTAATTCASFAAYVMRAASGKMHG